MSNKEKLLALHGQLLAGDPRAASQIVELVIAPLVAIVLRDVPGRQEDAEEACFDALFKYLASPIDYDPQRAELMTYLAAIAKGKAMTTRRAQARRRKNEGEFAAQGKEGEGTDLALNENAMLRQIDRSRILERFGHELIKDPGDERIFHFMTMGETSLPVFAEALGLPVDEAGLNEAGRRVERMRGRVRRIGERMSA